MDRIEGIDYSSFDESYFLKIIPRLGELSACPQSPIHHAEGDVWKHTKMVMEVMLQSLEFKCLPQPSKRVLFLAGLLHDIGKPARTKIDQDGEITSFGHSRTG